MDPLSLPALAVLITLKGLPGFGVKKPAPAEFADSLPPAWRPVSRLVLENEFVTGRLPEIVRERGGLQVPSDPRTLRVSVDAGTGTLSSGALVQSVPVGPPLRLSLDRYGGELTTRNFARLWRRRSIESINNREALASPTGPTGAGLSFRLPSPLPRRVQSLLGPGGPAINVAGSENIRLSGTSNWTNRETTLLGQRRSLFPSLDMQQDLDIKLEGQLSDRIKVNLLQNSAVQIPLANRIFINYRGEEDDMVQALDLGNTSLSLPGTQYVSYSGKNEGLFGVKSALRFGPADFTLLASKQEGRSERATYAGGASREERSIPDIDYIPGVYFMLFDPDDLLDPARSPAWIPPEVYALPGFAGIEIPDQSIHLYLDDGNYNNDVTFVRGKALVDPERRGCEPEATRAVVGNFSILDPPGAERPQYEILRDLYGPTFKVLRMGNEVAANQTLAVSYQWFAVDQDRRQISATFSVGGGREPEVDCVPPSDTTTVLRLKLLRPPSNTFRADTLPGPGNVVVFDTADAFTRVRDLELRNFYQLPGRGIDPASFQLSIRRGVEQPYQVAIPQGDGTSVPYVELLGLDSQDESGGSALPGHDGRVDGTSPLAGARGLVDFQNGILFFPDLRPFAPRIAAGPGSRVFEQSISNSLLRRETLTGSDEELNSSNILVYDHFTRRSEDKRYYIDVELSATSAVGEITLGRGNLLEGSEVVTVSGATWVRDRDYTIDYDLGRLTLKKRLGPTDQLNVNYSYAPLFAQAGRTLIGSDVRVEGRDKRLGGALVYESRGAQDLRPRIGEEPSRSVIADLNTDWTLRPDWVTRMVDRLPGVRTTAPSDFHFQGEMGASFPNPNTKNVVYLDDMESVRDAVSLSMSADRWKHMSVPRNLSEVGAPPMTDLPARHYGEIRWYSPPNAIKEHDLNPGLTDAQGGGNSRQVLAMGVPRRPDLSYVPATDSLWTGLVYPLDTYGLDISRSQFIEVWVNDFNDHHVGGSSPAPRVRHQGVRLHIDLGVVSEDQIRAPNRPPNGKLDTEDKSRDGQLSVGGSNNEDTGVDSLANNAEPGDPNSPLTWADLTTADRDDREGDDFERVNEDAHDDNIDSRRYKGTTGTEDNHNLLPYPDTEDLNLNTALDPDEDFFQYTIHLGDPSSPYLRKESGGIEVLRDFPGSAFADSLNGWRRYRIPIADSLRKVFGNPDLTLARHVRIWMEGVVTPDPTDAEVGSGPVRPMLMLGGFEIVGSRWQSAALDSASQAGGTTFTLNSVNNIDDRATYEPPFDPGDALAGNRTAQRREQSLSLEFSQLLPGRQIEAFRTFSLDENYSRYGTLTWYAKGFDLLQILDPVADTLVYFVRFASDEQGRSYYEFNRRLTNANIGGFEAVELALTALSNLKLNADFPLRDPIHYVAPGLRAGDSLVVHGRPSFTRLRRISVGLRNLSGTRTISRGQLWFNELRAQNVAKDAGTAGRLLLDGRFANLARYNVSYNRRDADFVTVGETRGSGNTSSQFGASGGVDLHRFFEATGVNLPVNGSFSRNVSRPRFTAGDDVVRPGALQAASETRGESRSFSTSYSRNWSPTAHPLLRHTIGGISANLGYGESEGRSPTSLTTGNSRNASVNYATAPRDLLKLRLPGTKLLFHPLPERVFWSYSTSSSRSESFDRQRDGTILPRSNIASRTAMVAFGADTRPIDLFHHHFDAERNLTLPSEQMERVGFINFGKVVKWKQNMDSRYTLNRGPWLSPGFTWNSSYSQDNRPELSKDLSVRGVNNGQGVGVNWSLPLERLAPARRAANDTTRRRITGGLLARDALSRVGNLSADLSVSQASSYSRITGTPSLGYLMGFHSDPGIGEGEGAVRVNPGNSFARSSDLRASGRTRFSLGYDAYVGARGEYTSGRSNSNDIVTRKVGSRFPELDVEYGRVGSLVRINKLMENPILRTSYSRSVSSDYRGGSDQPITRLTSSQWQPMLGLSGMLRNQTRAELKIDRRVAQRENFQLNGSVSTDRNTDVNLNLSRSYTRGQKVTMLGRESTVRSTVNLTLAMAYSKQSSENRVGPQRLVQSPRNSDRLSVNFNGSYSFSGNVTGNLGLGFGQNRNLETEETSRNIRVELRAAFTF